MDWLTIFGVVWTTIKVVAGIISILGMIVSYGEKDVLKLIMFGIFAIICAI